MTSRTDSENEARELVDWYLPSTPGIAKFKIVEVVHLAIRKGERRGREQNNKLLTSVLGKLKRMVKKRGNDVDDKRRLIEIAKEAIEKIEGE